jgi:hypothetical protein
MTDRSREDVEEIARRRAEARRAGDFTAADELRAKIETAGWKVVDSGYKFRLEPASPSTGVASRLDEPAAAPVTIVAIDAAAQVPAGLVPATTQIVAVGEPPAGSVAGVEVVELPVPVRLAEAWNIGLRRAVGGVVVLLGPGIIVTGDLATPVAKALADETIAVVGAKGLESDDLRHWRATGTGEVDALDAECLAFRRADAAARGPLDERFSSSRLLAIWWSLVLRDEGPDRPPRRALAVDMPLDGVGAAEGPDERGARRDFYRVLDRFGRRHDLLRRPVRPKVG